MMTNLWVSGSNRSQKLHNHMPKKYFTDPSIISRSNLGPIISRSNLGPLRILSKKALKGHSKRKWRSGSPPWKKKILQKMASYDSQRQGLRKMKTQTRHIGRQPETKIPGSRRKTKQHYVYIWRSIQKYMPPREREQGKRKRRVVWCSTKMLMKTTWIHGWT